MKNSPACTGTIGLAPSGNLNPDRRFPSLFEPVHGSAPDIAGKGVANPIAMIWSGAMMLAFLAAEPGLAPDTAQACQQAHDAILKAIEDVLRAGPRTADLGGAATTIEAGDAIAALVSGQG